MKFFLLSIVATFFVFSSTLAAENKELAFPDVSKYSSAFSLIEDDLIENGMATLYIEFDLGEATITKFSENVIDELASVLAKNSSWEISIIGHTDNSGSKKRNQSLSEQRAKAVYNAIIAKGIQAQRLEFAGKGSDFPLNDNNTEESRAKNRRVEIIKK